jgi:hypothetical protein
MIAALLADAGAYGAGWVFPFVFSRIAFRGMK